MPFLQSDFSFGSYVFPISFRVASFQQSTQIDEIKISNIDGSNAPAGTFQARTIQLVGSIGSNMLDSSGTPITTKAQALAEAALMASAMSNGFAALTLITQNKFYIAQLKQFKTDWPEATRGVVLNCTLDFLVPDPRAFTTTQTISSGMAPGASYTANALGTAVTYPIVTITATGAVVNPILTVTNSLGHIILSPTVTLANTNVLIIDSNPRNRALGIRLNGTPRLDVLTSTNAIVNTIGNSATFPYLIPGANTVSVSGSANYTWSVAWNDAFAF